MKCFYGRARWRMFKRRDIPPMLLLLLLIVLVMLTLSQILVVHNGRYGGRTVHNMRRLQLELREMDINLHSLMLKNVPSIELNRRLLQNQINAERIAAIIRQAAEPQSSAKRTASPSEGQDPVLKYEQESGHSPTYSRSQHLTSFPAAEMRNPGFQANNKDSALQSSTKSAQLVAQQSLQSRKPRDGDLSRSDSGLNEAQKNSNQAVVPPSATQLDPRNSTLMHHSEKSQSASYQNKGTSSAPDSIHKQRDLNNVPNTFHLPQLTGQNTSYLQAGSSVNNMANQAQNNTSSSRDLPTASQNSARQPIINTRLDLYRLPVTQNTEQTSPARTVPPDTTPRTLAYCPSIPPGLRKYTSSEELEASVSIAFNDCGGFCTRYRQLVSILGNVA